MNSGQSLKELRTALQFSLDKEMWSYQNLAFSKWICKNNRRNLGTFPIDTRNRQQLGGFYGLVATYRGYLWLRELT